VGHGDALVVLDWSPGVAWVAYNGGQEARRRSSGGGGRSKKERAKCVCANARAGMLGAPGCARSPEEDGIAREQELARQRRAWRHGEARVAAGLAWRVRRMAAGAKLRRRPAGERHVGSVGSRRWR
jgi:hypothetical protein